MVCAKKVLSHLGLPSINHVTNVEFVTQSKLANNTSSLYHHRSECQHQMGCNTHENDCWA